MLKLPFLSFEGLVKGDGPSSGRKCRDVSLNHRIMVVIRGRVVCHQHASDSKVHVSE